MSLANYRYNSKLPHLALLIISVVASMAFTSCRKTVGPTHVRAQDSIRHYYPIVQKEELRMVYELTNEGPEPLVVTDIMPSCVAISLESNMPDVIPVGKTERLNFIFHSDMNVGYVSHDIRIYGNILPNGVCKLTFDVHVVRPTLERSDYEEIYFDKRSLEEVLVDGTLGEKGYWVGDGNDDEDFSRHYNNPLD